MITSTGQILPGRICGSNAKIEIKIAFLAFKDSLNNPKYLNARHDRILCNNHKELIIRNIFYFLCADSARLTVKTHFRQYRLGANSIILKLRPDKIALPGSE